MATIAARILAELQLTTTPLDQTSIAFRTGDIFASVRRTVQELTKANRIHIADYRGVTGFPRFAFGPRPPVVSQADNDAMSQDTGFSQL